MNFRPENLLAEGAHLFLGVLRSRGWWRLVLERSKEEPWGEPCTVEYIYMASLATSCFHSPCVRWNHSPSGSRNRVNIHGSVTQKVWKCKFLAEGKWLEMCFNLYCRTLKTILEAWSDTGPSCFKNERDLRLVLVGNGAFCWKPD